MRYIEQLLENYNPKKLWLYLPFPLLFGGIMLMNWVATQVSEQGANEMIAHNIELYGKNINFLISVGPLAFLLLMLLVWVKNVQKQSITSLTTSRKKIDWKRIRFSFITWTIVSLGVFAYQYFQHPEHYEFNFQFWPFFGFLILALLLLPLQTSFEEYFIRAYLMQGIGVATRSRAMALVITSLFFGLLHLANPEVEQIGYSIMIYYIGSGFFLGIMTLMDEGIELALGFHAANNIIGALLVTANWTAFQTNSIFIDVAPAEEGMNALDFLIQVGVIFPLLLILFSRVYKWSNWKDKLIGKVIKPS